MVRSMLVFDNPDAVNYFSGLEISLKYNKYDNNNESDRDIIILTWSSDTCSMYMWVELKTCMRV